MAECRSARVATATRAANVEALNSWSACSVRATSITRATSALGARPSSSVRNHAACESAAAFVTGSRPVRMRCQAATSAGISAVSRIALRRFGSGSMDAASGSSAAAADTAVRSASRGWPSRGRPRRRATSGGGSSRAAARRARNARAASGAGSSPNHRSWVTSSKGTAPARSPIS